MTVLQLGVRLRAWLVSPRPKFKIGDCVQQIGSDSLMVVVKIYSSRRLPHILIECKWSESGTNITRINLFQEDQLVLFDWNAALKNLQ